MANGAMKVMTFAQHLRHDAAWTLIGALLATAVIAIVGKILRLTHDR